MSSLVAFQEYNSVLCNSIKPIRPIPTNLTFTFENYIRSQIYFPMMPYVGNRKLQDYLNSCKFLDNNDMTEVVLMSVCKVLKYFYRDLASSLIKSGNKYNYPEGFNFYIQRSCEDRFTVRVIEESEMNWREKVNILLEYSQINSIETIIEMR